MAWQSKQNEGLLCDTKEIGSLKIDFIFVPFAKI